MPTLDKAGNILQLNQMVLPRFPRRVIAIGDSITGRWATGTTVTSITVSNGIATCTTSGGHGSYPGGKVFLSGLTPDIYNGIKTVRNRISNTIITFEVPNSLATNASVSSVSTCTSQTLGNDRSYFNVANTILNGAFDLRYNVGASGETLTEIRARLYRDCLDYKPELVILEGGINDIQGATTATASTPNAEYTTFLRMKDDMKWMISQCLGQGCYVVVTNCLPLNSNVTAYTAARANLVLVYNAWLKEYVRNFSNVLLLDAYRCVVSGEDAEGDMIADYDDASQHIHPTPLACQAIGIELAAVLEPLAQVPLRSEVTSIIDVYSATTNPNGRQIDGNPLNQGNGTQSAATGAGSGTASGTPPSGWTGVWNRGGAAGSCTLTKPACADGIGKDFQIVLVGDTAGDSYTFIQTTSIHAPTLPGDVLRACRDMTISGVSGLAEIYWAWEWGYTDADGAATYTNPSLFRTTLTASFATGQFSAPPSGKWILPDLVVPPKGITSLKTRFRIVLGDADGTGASAGGITVKFGKGGVWIKDSDTVIG